MSSLGIHSQTINWCKSYLSARSFRVKVEDSLSASFPAPTGVPQGSCLSPLLYTIFISDINKFLPENIRYLVYADDLKIYCPILSDSCHLLLQSAVDGVSRWCHENGMLLSPTKCVVLKYGFDHLEYHMNGSTLPSADTTRDLGIHISPTLDFSSHIYQTIQSASIMIGTIFRCFSSKNVSFYKHLYKSLVLSKFLYCSPVWLPYLKKHIIFLNRVHKKFIRRLRWRCGLPKSYNLSDIPNVYDSMAAQDVRTLPVLHRANLLSHFFYVSPNNLRSKCTARPKVLAHTEKIRNMFSWRVAKRLCDRDCPESNLDLLTLCVNTPLSI